MKYLVKKNLSHNKSDFKKGDVVEFDFGTHESGLIASKAIELLPESKVESQRDLIDPLATAISETIAEVPILYFKDWKIEIFPNFRNGL